MTRPLVVGLGKVGVALTGLTARLPELGADGGTAELAAVDLAVAPGVAVAVRAATALGSGRVSGICATDPLGRFARALLGTAGIDVEGLTPWGDAAACTITALDPQGRRLVLDHAGIDPEQGPPVVDVGGALTNAGALLVDGSWMDAQVVAARAARARKIPVVVDVSDVVGGTGELVGLADVLIASERVAAELAPRAELPDALAQMSALGPRAVIVTMGEAGAIGLHGQTLVQCPAFPVEALDTSGAGSVFHGAFAAGLLSQLPLARCMELAAAAAALACRGLGPWDGIPRREDVVDLVRTRG